jgi:polyisoprenoid-binding protein YceI
VESEKYPRAVFKGKILNNDAVNYISQGYYTVNVEGDMTIHGETRKVYTEGTIEVSAEDIIAKAKFLLNPEDYEIKIPKLVRNNIAEKLEITVEFNLFPL